MDETIKAKEVFKQYAQLRGVIVKHYHADNGCFADKGWMNHVQQKGQTITFSGVGAKFQNGVSERAIQTVQSWALANMMHVLLHWPSAFDETLWPFALDHVVHLWNHMPQMSSGLSPIEIFTGTKTP